MDRWFAIPLCILWVLFALTAYVVLTHIVGWRWPYAFLGASIVLWLGSFVLKAAAKRR